MLVREKHHNLFMSTVAGAAMVIVAAATTVAQETVPNEYIVQLKEGQNAAEVKAENVVPPGTTNATITRRYRLINAVAVRVDPPAAVAAGSVARTFRAAATRLPTVERVDPNYRYYKSGSRLLPQVGSAGGEGAGGASAGQGGTADPHLSRLWYLERIGAQKGWTVRRESPDIIVAVIDTGVHYGHEDLKDNIWVNPGETAGDNVDNDNNGIVDDVHGADFFTGDGDPTPQLVPSPRNDDPSLPHPTNREFEAHGTHVAGTIGAMGDNGKGIVGITRKVKIMPLKFLGGFEGSGDLDDAVAAIEYAVANGATIINASWGGGGRAQVLEDAIRQAQLNGVLFVAAAGNGNPFTGLGENNDSIPHFPSSYDVSNILAVAATSKGTGSPPTDPLTSFSNFGLQSVDLAAPGFDILSTVPTGNAGQPGSGYDSFNGTSMATPIVSGTAALIRAQFPNLSPEQVIQVLRQTVDHSSQLRARVASGGRLNIANTLTLTPPTPAGPVATAAPRTLPPLQTPPDVVGAAAGATRTAAPVPERVRQLLRPRPAMKYSNEEGGQ